MSLIKRTTRRGDDRTDAKSVHIEIEDDEVEIEDGEETGGRGRTRTVALGALAGAAALVWWRRRRTHAVEIERESMVDVPE